MSLPAEAFAQLGEGFARELLGGLTNPNSKGPPWPFAHGAAAIRERLGDLISVIGAEPASPGAKLLNRPLSLNAPGYAKFCLSTF
jgi:hypothetical protein